MAKIDPHASLIDRINAHRDNLAQLVAHTPVTLPPCHRDDIAALQLAEEIRQASHGRHEAGTRSVRYQCYDTDIRAAMAAALGESGYDADEFLSSIR